MNDSPWCSTDTSEIIHGLARDGHKARQRRRGWTGSVEHRYYLDGRMTALETKATNLAFEYANTEGCDWWPKGSPRRSEA